MPRECSSGEYGGGTVLSHFSQTGKSVKMKEGSECSTEAVRPEGIWKAERVTTLRSVDSESGGTAYDRTGPTNSAACQLH